jgi:hypothetical protein
MEGGGSGSEVSLATPDVIHHRKNIKILACPYVIPAVKIVLVT